MFSYLDGIKNEIDDSIYKRGLRLYLEGKVSKPTALILDFWRMYKVQDQNVCEVKVPMLHLALDEQKWTKSAKVLQEVASCSCSYFEEFGLCKHIVAVCASLEQEFNKSINKSIKKIEEKEINNILDSMFSVEEDQKQRRWRHALESFINSSDVDTTWWEEILRDIARNPSAYDTFTSWLKDLLEKTQRTFEGELRVVVLIKQAWYQDSDFWWYFFLPNMHKMEEHNQLKLWVSLWKMVLAGILKKSLPVIKNQIVQFSDTLKQQILESLQKDFQSQPKIWIEFAITSEYLTWLDTNLQYLDPLTLIKMYPLFSDSDEIEEILLKQVKVWSDFLQPSNYDDLAKVLHSWLRSIGRTEYYEQAWKYVTTNHHKKRKLMSMLEK